MRLDNQGRAILRMLIYPIQFSANPVEAIDHVFDYRVLPGLTDTPQHYLDAIDDGLESKEQLSLLIPQNHSESVIRNYLSAVGQRLR
jgi:hypothetical protein